MQLVCILCCSKVIKNALFGHSFSTIKKKCDTYFLYKIIDLFLVILPKSINSLHFSAEHSISDK
uniref:Uncharacterized protein n=1 Tax=Arundo donax TaxID=35708 RepID=A0A0A9CFX0_ARUDO